METQRLGNSDLLITPIGIGAWAMGGSGWTWSWGPQNDHDSVAAIHDALDRGINWIDTAAVYGLGHSEEVVKQALHGRRQRPYVFTKCERTWDANGKLGGTLKAASIRRECEDSLRRLGVDLIDLYQIHWPEPDADIEEGWTEMARLQEEGKVRYIGVSNFNVAQMKRAADDCADYFFPAALFDACARGRGVHPALCRGAITLASSSIRQCIPACLSGGMTRQRISFSGCGRLASAESKLPRASALPQSPS